MGLAGVEVWEDRKIRSNGHDGLVVSVPKDWLDLPAETVFQARFIFEKKDGKRSVRLAFPGEL